MPRRCCFDAATGQCPLAAHSVASLDGAHVGVARFQRDGHDDAWIRPEDLVRTFRWQVASRGGVLCANHDQPAVGGVCTGDLFDQLKVRDLAKLRAAVFPWQLQAECPRPPSVESTGGETPLPLGLHARPSGCGKKLRATSRHSPPVAVRTVTRLAECSG